MINSEQVLLQLNQSKRVDLFGSKFHFNWTKTEGKKEKSNSKSKMAKIAIVCVLIALASCLTGEFDLFPCNNNKIKNDFTL